MEVRRLILMAFFRLALLLIGALTFGSVSKAQEGKPPPAELGISGAGFWDNRELKKMLHLLDENLGKRPTFDANYLEDTALLILSEVRRDGYLNARISLILTLEDGTGVAFMTSDEGLLNLPRPLSAVRADYRIEEGVRFYYDDIRFDGLESITPDEALRYFIGTDFLIRRKALRIFTSGRLDQGMSSLLEKLRQKGYRDAKVEVAREDRNSESGAVSIKLAVSEGPKYMVRSVVREVKYPAGDEPGEAETNRFSAPYSEVWEQDYKQTLQRERYHQGYPDASVDLKVVRKENVDETVQVDLRAVVTTGPRIRVGAIQFEGNRQTREWLLRRRSELKPGEWLDRIKAEEARFRLARLGVFDSVKMSYDQVGPDTRDITYTMEEGKRTDVSLLAGYGSYELLRGGVEMERRNIFGLAQRARLRALQSFKSTTVDLLYTAPELVGRDIDVFFEGTYLRREEVSFIRLEYGGSVGVQRFFDAIHSDLSLRYNYQVLNAEDAPTESLLLDNETTVSSFTFSLKHDRRDNPLYPRHGYKVSTSIEYASPLLAGDADYLRPEAAASLHLRLGGGRYLHFGVEHGVAVALSSSSTALPFNKRFFPGGENSVRGYQYGEASPLDASGQEVGAESYIQGNLELEQALTPSWALVAFVDGVELAEDLSDYPGDEILYSAGGGIRWKTIVGPVRLEYGHNLNPRRSDPDGTIHFSIGFPF